MLLAHEQKTHPMGRREFATQRDDENGERYHRRTGHAAGVATVGTVRLRGGGGGRRRRRQREEEKDAAAPPRGRDQSAAGKDGDERKWWDDDDDAKVHGRAVRRGGEE